MIADAHCHAWRVWPYPPTVPYPLQWGDVNALLFEMDRNDIDFAAVVCARIGSAPFENPDNNSYVHHHAQLHPDRLLAVADVDGYWSLDYHRAGASDRLRRWHEQTGSPMFNHYLDTTNDGWLVSDEGQEFFRTAADLNLVVSLSANPPWFDDLQVIAANNADLPIFVHHLGAINITRPPEIAQLLALAGSPNIILKVSGFHYLGDPPWAFPYSMAQGVLRSVVDTFGPHRLCWGSDYPASKPHQTYRQSLETVRTSSALSPAVLPGILGENLTRILATRRPSQAEK